MNILDIDFIYMQVILKITLQKVANIFKIISSSPKQKKCFRKKMDFILVWKKEIHSVMKI